MNFINNSIESILNLLQTNIYVKVAGCLIGFVFAFKLFFKHRRTKKREAYPKDVVILHQFPRSYYF